MIKEQQEQISLLYLTLQSQVNTVEKASKYEKERKSIMCENRKLREKCENMEKDYSIKLKEEIQKIENKYENDIYLNPEKQIEYEEEQEYEVTDC